jgi:hypothetical protein
MKLASTCALLLLALAQPGAAQPAGKIQYVFLILMENHDWSQIYGSAQAPYINNELLPISSFAEQYYNPPGIHPSLPNYLWLEAGDNFGIRNDSLPRVNHQDTTEHLVTLLENAGYTWRSWQEDITGEECPLTNHLLYRPKHNPMVYFDDVTDTNDPNSAYCIDRVRPYEELESALESGDVPNYNFITPNQCNDMHDCGILTGDTWLSNEVPKILNSKAFQEAGVLFITWDEGRGTSDGPIGMIVLSPFAKAKGYSNSTYYTHSSTLRTIQEIFGLEPLLRDAANAEDLTDLFAGEGLLK